MAFCSCWCLFFSPLSPPLKLWLGMFLPSRAPRPSPFLPPRNWSSEVRSRPMRILSSFKSEFSEFSEFLRLSKFLKSLRNCAWSEVWRERNYYCCYNRQTEQGRLLLTTRNTRVISPVIPSSVVHLDVEELLTPALL